MQGSQKEILKTIGRTITCQRILRGWATRKTNNNLMLKRQNWEQCRVDSIQSLMQRLWLRNKQNALARTWTNACGRKCSMGNLSSLSLACIQQQRCTKKWYILPKRLRNSTCISVFAHQYNGKILEEVPKISLAQDIPTVVSELKIYFNNWKVNTKSKLVWLDVRIGFNSNRATFLEDWVSMLSDNKHKFWVATLQKPFTKEEYMLKESHPDMNADEHCRLLLALMTKISKEEGCPKDILMAFKQRKIMDGNYSKQNKNNEEGGGEDEGKKSWNKVHKAIYITLPHNRLKEGTRLLSKAMAHKDYKAYNGMNVSVIPKNNRFTSSATRMKMLNKIAIHNDVVGDRARVILADLLNINRPNDKLDGQTSRQVIMKIRRPNNLLEPAFLCVDTKTWGGDGTVVTYPKAYEDSRSMAEMLPGVLYHTYGNEVKMWLTRDGFREAKETAWDMEMNRPSYLMGRSDAE